MAKRARSEVAVRPLERSDWPLVEALFGERGACAGCWCMVWRLSRKVWEEGRGAKNRRAFRRLIESGRAAGVLAIHEDRAVGWCSTGPRADFAALAKERGASRIEGYPVAPPKDGGDLPAVFAWTGLPQVFERAGFQRLAETPGKHPI